MSDGKIYITISDERGTSSVSPQQPTQKPQQIKKTAEKSEDGNFLYEYAKHEFMHMVRQTASTAINYSISTIGGHTGNYNVQRLVQENISVLEGLKNIGISTAVGAKTAGLPGAIIGLMASTFTTALQYGMKESENAFQILKQNNEIDKLRDRAGLNSRTNGGRTGV